MVHPLRTYRKTKGLSLATIATMLGVTEAQISRIECGKRVCTPEMAIKIEAATDGGLSRWKMRPDLWCEPVDAAEREGAAA